MTMLNNDKLQMTPISRRLDGPKLRWFTDLLVVNDIPHQIAAHGIYGPVIEVARDFFFDAWAILNASIGQSHIGLADMVWDDLPNDHPVFNDEAFVPKVELGQEKLKIEFTVLGIKKADFPGTEDVEVKMWQCESSNISALGFVSGEVLYCLAQFKGGTITYRYFGISSEDQAQLLNEIEDKVRGNANASVGKLFNRLVKNLADEGTIVCQKYVDGEWVIVPPKSQRPKKGKLKKFVKEAEVEKEKPELEKLAVDPTREIVRDEEGKVSFDPETDRPITREITPTETKSFPVTERNFIDIEDEELKAQTAELIETSQLAVTQAVGLDPANSPTVRSFDDDDIPIPSKPQILVDEDSWELPE